MGKLVIIIIHNKFKGSGKTYTMMGNYSIDEKRMTVPGLYLLAA